MRHDDDLQGGKQCKRDNFPARDNARTTVFLFPTESLRLQWMPTRRSASTDQELIHASQNRLSHCDTVYNLADATIGKKVRCKKCNEAFTVEDVPVDEEAEQQIQSGERGRLRSSPARLRDEDEDDFDDDRPSRRLRRPVRKSSSSDFPVLAVTLIAGGVVLAAVLILVGAWLFIGTKDPEASTGCLLRGIEGEDRPGRSSLEAALRALSCSLAKVSRPWDPGWAA
jgi:predicted Zn finger-like uncharacterized protein